jgi:undecaprenyl-diphosphatase
MDLSSLQPLMHWLSTHSGWAGLVVFLIAFAESLLLVGLLFPGTIIMFGIGTLVAMGAFSLWGTLIAAAVGAAAGDGLSFWLGYHYKSQLRDMWPIRRYPALLKRGEQFFLRHGGKSVLFGRFVGPVRPILPTVAGMLGMSPLRFVIIDIFSSLAWAPVYTLPGILFGASMGVASEIASRLAVLVLSLLAVLWLAGWLVYRIYRYLQPRGMNIVQRLLSWGAAHRYAGQVVSSVLDPTQSEARGLIFLGTLLICVALALVSTGHHLFGDRLTLVNAAVHHTLQELRVPWADRLMLSFAELGSRTILLSLTVTISLWFAVRRVWLAMLHIIAGAAFAVLLTLALDWSRNTPLSEIGAVWASGPAVMGTVLYGLLAVMITQGLSGVQRWVPYAIAGMMITAINISQLYLGGLWLSQVAAGSLLALLWVVILGTAYRLHATIPVAPRILAIIAFATLAAAGAVQYGTRYEHDLARYTPQHPVIPLAAADWWASQWRTLPGYRIDLKGSNNQPLTVQWSGSLEELKQQLRQRGWQSPPRLTARNMLQWLRSEPKLSELPLLPQAHDGRYDVLRLIRPGGDPEHLTVLRLWSSNYRLLHPAGPLWLGTASQVHASHPLPWVTVPITGQDFDEPLHVLENDLTGLGGLEWRAVQRRPVSSVAWNGTVVLVRPKQDP